VSRLTAIRRGRSLSAKISGGSGRPPVIRGSAPNMGMFLIWAPLISVPYVTYAKEVRHVFCAPAMPKSSEHILTSI